MGPDTTKTLSQLPGARHRVATDGPLDGPQGIDGERPPGKFLGRYVVLYRVGSGGMGVVYAAYDPELDRKVAVKVMRRLGSDAEVSELARAEAQAMARLTHANVVTVHDVGAEQGHLFIAMEFVAGRTLKEWLREEAPDWQQVVDKFVQAGHGLAAAHRAGLVHRDFKPSNVMLSQDGGVKVLDFGLAQLPRQKSDDSSAERRPLIGTRAYLPPERLLGEESQGSSDQFSFCAALWQALYGELPFAVDDPDIYLEQIGRGQPQESSGKSIPGWLKQALLRGLKLQPEDRYPDLETLLQDISPEGRRSRWRRRQGLLAGGLVAVLLPFVWFSGPGGEDPPCGPFDHHLQGVWDAPRKQTIHDAFLSTGVSFAEAAWRSTSQILDDYGEAWLDQRREACEATHLRQEQSPVLLDQRMACLDRQFEPFRALSDALAQANATTVIDAVRTASALDGLAACRDGALLSRQPLLPEDPELRREIEEIRLVAESQLARQRFHRPVDLDLLRRTTASAEATGYAPILARTLYALGWIEGRRGLRDEAVRHLVRAAQMARLAADPDLEIRSFAALIKLESSPPADFERAEMWLSFAKAQSASLESDHPELAWEVAEAAGWLAFAQQTPEAAVHWGRALELAEQVWGPDSPRVAAVLSNLSLLGTVDSESYLRRAIYLIESWYGADHPALARPLSKLAAFEASRGRYREAITLVRRALAVLDSDTTTRAPERAYPMTLLAQLYTATDRPQLAIEVLQQAQNQLDGQGPGAAPQPEAPTVGDVSVGDAVDGDRFAELRLSLILAKSRAELLLDDLDSAERTLTAAGPLLQRDRSAAAPTHRLQALSLRASLLTRRGKVAQGLALHEELVSRLQEASVDGGDGAVWLLEAAESMLAANHPERSLDMVQRALLLTRAENDPRRAARGHFIAARCLWPEAPVIAHSRAEQALGLLTGDEIPRRRLRRDIEQWLVEHPLASE